MTCLRISTHSFRVAEAHEGRQTCVRPETDAGDRHYPPVFVETKMAPTLLPNPNRN